MDNQTADPIAVKNQAYRPLALSVACIFSFIYNGILLLLSLLSLIYISYVKEIFLGLFGNQPVSDFMLYLVPASAALMFLLAIYGVALMWKLKRSGFYIFLISKIILVFLLIFHNYLNYFNLGLSLFMIIFYWSYQRKFSDFTR